MMKIEYRAKHYKKRRRRLPVHVYLVYLCMITLLLTGVSFSRYIFVATGKDSADTAVFAVSAEPDSGQSSDITIESEDADLSQSFSFKVMNSGDGRASEVAIRYDVIVTLPQALPSGVEMTLEGYGSLPLEDGNTYIYSDAGQFAAGKSEEHTHKLNFTVNPDEVTDSAKLQNITITVHAEQID